MFRWSESIRARRGAVLMIVLVMVFVASVLVVRVVEELTLQIRAKTAQVSRDELRYVGLSALEATLGVLGEFKEIDGHLHGPGQGWSDPLAYASTLEWPEGVTIEVTVTDETGKFPLNEVTTTELTAFFNTLDINTSDAETMSDSLLDWMDEDEDTRLNGAEESFYEREDPPLSPANAPLSSWEALRYIKGFRDHFFDENGVPNSLYYRFIRSFSLHTSTDANVNTANEDVLETLADQAGFDVDYLIDHRSGRDRVVGTYDDEYYASADDLSFAGIAIGSAAVTYVCEILKVEVRVSFGEKAYLLTALVNTGEADQSESGGGSRSGSGASESGGTDGPNSGTPGSSGSGSSGGRSGAGTSGSGSVTESGSNYPFTIVKLVESMEVD
ncbi:general secretion pathway protein GspK [Ruficoccus amylovorans]|uniref:General secretion pathway protein GspK n=1 Tax=Ruficoccus amylovorans TaxID=1804625 RepID=A0A842H868_9BACT|nr:type II secretion system protein GspK [Ruficoccus amylovorans]MBC2592723.1 general secretion pathway protein GspK [Ruficoccus amylovorans]